MEGLTEERCALVAELGQVLEMARQLEAHMAGQQGGVAAAGGGEQRCRALVSTMRASIARKTLPKWSTQVRVSAVQDVTPLDDGLSWRKYGQKDILGAKYPRAYFRCTHRHTQSCYANKQVQRTDGDPLLFDVVYHGDHTCAQAQAAAHPSNQRARPAASAEPQTGGQEQTSATALFEGPAMLLASLPSNKPAGAEASPGATSSGFPVGCVTACLDSSSYAVGGGGNGMAGVRNVPDLELASTTNSPMGDMDFMFPLDDSFLENPGYF